MNIACKFLALVQLLWFDFSVVSYNIFKVLIFNFLFKTPDITWHYMYCTVIVSYDNLYGIFIFLFKVKFQLCFFSF